MVPKYNLIARVPYGGISVNDKNYRAGQFFPGRRSYAQARKQSDIPMPPDLDHAHLKTLDLHKIEPSWNKNGQRGRNAYGGVIFNHQGQVLLVEPTNHFLGYHWTFPKGGIDPGEHPIDTGLREVKEETGHDTSILGLVPNRFPGPSGTSYSQYFVMRSHGQTGRPSWETQNTRWATPDEAHRLIDQSTTQDGKKRDHAVLDAALSHLNLLKSQPETNEYLRPITKRQAYSRLSYDHTCSCTKCAATTALNRVIYSQQERHKYDRIRRILYESQSQSVSTQEYTGQRRGSRHLAINEGQSRGTKVPRQDHSDSRSGLGGFQSGRSDRKRQGSGVYLNIATQALNRISYSRKKRSRVQYENKGELQGDYYSGWTPQWKDKVTPAEFIRARNNTKYPGFLSPLVEDDIKNHKLILSHDAKVGVAVSPEGDIQNLFNNGGPKGAGIEARLQAMHYGGYTGDSFAPYLTHLYQQTGFHETGRMKFNREYAPPGWDYEKHGEPDVVFMARDRNQPFDDDAIRRRVHDRSLWSPAKASGRYFDDWDSAKAHSRREGDPNSYGSGERRERSESTLEADPGHRTSVGRSVNIATQGHTQSRDPRSVMRKIATGVASPVTQAYQDVLKRVRSRSQK